MTIGEWLEEQKETLKTNNRVELVFKRFYKWLDSVIEDVTTQAMKQVRLSPNKIQTLLAKSEVIF